jgi:hypothetical protein
MGSKIRIVIVDENKDVVSMVAAAFGLNGYQVYKSI